MCEKMEEFVNEPRPLSMDGEWSPCVNSRADKAEQDRKNKISWAEQQKANRRAEKRARRFMNAIAAALALIGAGGVCLNYVDGVPVWIAASVAVLGISIFAFVLGWICGHKARR